MKLPATEKLAWVPPAVLALVLCAGCSGINTSQSVSPATFLLPGLLKAAPARPHGDPTLPPAPASIDLAQAR